jgi:hypothetical protein
LQNRNVICVQQDHCGRLLARRACSRS